MITALSIVPHCRVVSAPMCGILVGDFVSWDRGQYIVVHLGARSGERRAYHHPQSMVSSACLALLHYEGF